jgi:hypothetical protein
MKLIKLTLLATATFLTTNAPTQANIFASFARGSKNAMGVLSNEQNKAAVNGCSIDAATGLAREYCTLRETPTDSCFSSIKKQIDGYIQKEGAKFFTRTSPLILGGTSPKDAYGQCFGTARDMILKGTPPVDGAFFNSMNPEYARAPGSKFNIVAHQRSAQAAERAREEARREALGSQTSGQGGRLVLGGQETCPDVTALENTIEAQQQELAIKAQLLDKLAKEKEEVKQLADETLDAATGLERENDQLKAENEMLQSQGGVDPEAAVGELANQLAPRLTEEVVKKVEERLATAPVVVAAAPLAQPQAAAVSAPASAPVAPPQPAVDASAAARAEQERLAAEQARLAAEQAAEAERQAEAQRKAEAERTTKADVIENRWDDELGYERPYNVTKGRWND